MTTLGKRIEALVRRLRPYLRPVYRRAYRELLGRGLSQRRSGEPMVCCDFADSAMDAVGGRYYFSLVLDLIDAGYFPVFTARRITVSSFGTSRVKKLLLEKRLGAIQSVDEFKEPFLLITDVERKMANATKTVKVDYERRLPVSDREMPFPVFVHPQIAINGQLPFSYDSTGKRPARIFFGGNTEEGKYDKNVIGEVYSMLTRREMLAAVCEEVGEEKIHRPQVASEWLASDAPSVFVLCETQHCRIPPAHWLQALSKGDFFLACPGVGMPLCHNLVEALAAGSIPILQYDRYLTPALEDGVNCLTFRDVTSLKQVIARVLAMDEPAIQALREGVEAYYRSFMAPGRFAERLLKAGPPETLLMNSYRVPR